VKRLPQRLVDGHPRPGTAPPLRVYSIAQFFRIKRRKLQLQSNGMPELKGERR
jgi:hypothetical protein